MSGKSDVAKVEEAVQRFIRWLDKNGSQTYDSYDLMTTRYAAFARKIYFSNAALGLPFVFPILFADLIFPGIRKILVPKRRFAIVEAHLSMGFLNLFRNTNDSAYLDRAISLCEKLDEIKISGYNGPCWGYPFDWRSSNGYWKAGTPFITVTPYCFEAFLHLYEVTKDEKHLQYALSISRFAYHDLSETILDQDTIACSYSPNDRSQVINATAYRSFVLLHSFKYNADEQYRQKALAGLNFISKQQNSDGSWFYAANDAHNTFIDNFHSCFVLKNLIKCNALLKSAELNATISKGLRFYLQAFINPDFSLKPFIKSNKFNIAKENLYDYAEAINLAQLATPYSVEFQKARDQLIANVLSWQMNNGSFINQKNILSIQTRQSYLRWGIAPLFNSLTKSLCIDHIKT